MMNDMEACFDFTAKVFYKFNGVINTVNKAKDLIVCEKRFLKRKSHQNLMAFTTLSGLVVYPYWPELFSHAAMLNMGIIDNDLVKSFLLCLILHELSHQDQDPDGYKDANIMESSNDTRTFKFIAANINSIEEEFKFKFDPVLYTLECPYNRKCRAKFRTIDRPTKIKNSTIRMLSLIYENKSILLEKRLINKEFIKFIEGKYNSINMDEFRLEYKHERYLPNSKDLEIKMLFIRGNEMKYHPKRNVLELVKRDDIDISEVISNPYAWKWKE